MSPGVIGIALGREKVIEKKRGKKMANQILNPGFATYMFLVWQQFCSTSISFNIEFHSFLHACIFKCIHIYIIYSKIYRLKNNTIYTLVHTYQRSTIVRRGGARFTPTPTFFARSGRIFYVFAFCLGRFTKKKSKDAYRLLPEEKDPV